MSSDEDTTGYDYYSGTNRLKKATIGGVEYGFTPDSSGHIEQYACTDPDDSDEVNPCADVDDTFIEWNARGLAEKVTVGESKTTDTPAARDSFRYGPDGARYFKKSEWTVGSGATATLKTSRKYYAGAYEKTVTAGGETVERTRIGDSVVHVRTTPASMMASAPPPVFEYVHRDHLGSVEAVTNQAGQELIVLAHDPYGERRKNDWTARLTRAEIESLLSAQGERVSRGFTRHEHLDRTGLIHMNGRMYDPRLGRFLSPDPIVGDPTSSQSWNLYSYVGNNPLSYVDPTGLIQTGPCDALNSGCMHFGGGGAGGGSTRTITVTTTVTVSGVMSVPYRYAVPVWTQVWDPTLDHYVWYVGDEYFWGERSVPYSFSYNVTRTITIPDESVAEEPADSDSALVPGTVRVTRSVDDDTGEHYYRIRGVICKRSAQCDETWADKVFEVVNRNDIPFTSDDLREGVHDLLGVAPTHHAEYPDERRSRNKTLEGHPFHRGEVTHEVHFENDHLIYDVTGTGSGKWPSVNNAIGVGAFRPGVEDAVHRFSSPPDVRRYPRIKDIYP